MKIQEKRIQLLTGNPVKKNGKYVLYWMQQSQRTEFNHALEYAISRANELKKPLIVLFCLTENFPDANERHYYFMLQGLKEVKQSLAARKIFMAVRKVSPEIGVTELAEEAAIVITDRGYLKIQRQWRQNIAKRINCLFVQVESDVIVPVEEASVKEEYAAATFRSKILSKINNFLIPQTEELPVLSSLTWQCDSLPIEDIEQTIEQLKIDRSVPKANFHSGGTATAKSLLEAFISEKLVSYDQKRNDPTEDCQSQLSPYLHFGQISPLYIALKIMASHSPASEAFLEELIVRRELGMNFCYYNLQYDSFTCLPDWAKTTLKEHEPDRREFIYSLEKLEKAETHDFYWNAAQREMVLTGKMHGYMRMYWGKKILEWGRSPAEAFQTALYLNNKYELDGRDANSFAGIAWCFGKHDRAWGERSIFGKVRYMNANGLNRKFDAVKYVRKIKNLAR